MHHNLLLLDLLNLLERLLNDNRKLLGLLSGWLYDIIKDKLYALLSRLHHLSQVNAAALLFLFNYRRWLVIFLRRPRLDLIGQSASLV